MNNIAIYPVFQDKQTLSHHDLNNSFDYLQNQDGLTRVNLVGTGIVHGLKASFDGEAKKITISKGCGITSEGRLIFIEQDRIYSYYKQFEPVCKESSSSLNGTVHELKEERVVDGKAIDEDIVKDKVAVLFYDSNPQDILCSCDKNSNGREERIDIKLLLAPKEKFNNMLLTRLDYIELLPRLNIQESFYQIFSSELLSGKITSIKDRIKESYLFAEKKLKLKGARELGSGLDTIKIGENKQNIYDFLNDLISACNEFVYCGNKVVSMYLSSLDNFPCHLILGDIDEQEVDKDNYRHHFRPATASNDYSELKRLWERIVTMIEYFNPDVASALATDNSIRLTPSVYGAVPLSEKAVPYYYYKKNGGNEMPYTAWNNKRENPLGYWYKKENDGVGYYHGYYKGDNWKNYDLEQYNFVRIEGHVNISYDYEESTAKKTRKKQIEDIARQCNLPIAVIALRKTPSDGERCISESQEKILAALQDSAKEFVLNIKDSINIEEFLTSASIQADTALDVAEQAKQAAKSTVAEKMVNDAVGKVRTAVDLAKLANTTKTAATAIAAKKAAETATTAMNEAEKIAKGTTAEKAVNDAVTETVEAAQKIAKAAQAVQAEEAADAIGKEELNLESCLNSVDRITSTYEKVFSFACQNTNLKDHCQKISSFLQWIDMTYQQCEAKNVFSSFASFKDKHPGLQHKSGVPIGGTFILVYDDEDANKKIVADFCLPYRVTQPD